MADLRDYQAPFFAIHKTLANQRTSTRYQQLRACGADRVRVCIRSGSIRDFEFASDLIFQRLVAENSGSWRVATDLCAEFGDLQSWPQIAERMMAGARPQPDPRPAFADNPKVEEISGLTHYDPEVAQAISAVIFHRLFQTLESAFKQGLLADLDVLWTHGGRFWNDAPMPFAWNDNNGFCFIPQTCIDERISLYHPDRPNIRRYLHKTTYRLNDLADLKPSAESLIAKAPILSWSKNNIDRVILLPSAAAPIAEYFLNSILRDAPNNTRTASALGSDYVLLDTPADDLFARSGIIDAGGCAVQPLILIQNGRANAVPSIKNGHCSRPDQALNLYAPIFCAASEQPQMDYTPDSISAQKPGRILFIEKTVVADGKIFFPLGGILYHEGRFLGHAVAPKSPYEISSFLKETRPLGSPVRCGELAACAIEFMI